MKIAIVAPTPIPFLVGGAEKFFWGLQSAINQLTPHDAELIKIPCRDQDFWPLMDAYYRCSRLDLGYFDRIITTKYPAWMMSHPAHDVYMQHTCRGVYDLYGQCGQATILPRHKSLERLTSILSSPSPGRRLLEPFFQELFALKERPDLPAGTFDFPSPLTRGVIHFLDSIALSPNSIDRYFAISENVARRNGYFPAGIDVRAIHHPTDIRGLYCRSHDYLFTASRMEDLKRIHLLIEAFRKVDADIPFKIAGTGGQEAALRRLAEGDDRIEFLGFVSDAALIEYYAGALFVPFIPYDEDYGLITLEAMLCEKAVLTVHDAGGVTELVKDGVNGYIVQPAPDALAKAMGRMIENRDETIHMGQAARESVQHITWENTVAQLFNEPFSGSRPDTETHCLGRQRPGRKKIVVVNNFSVHQPVSGGQKRVYYLCRNLGVAADVTLVTFGTSGSNGLQCALDEGVTEICVPMSRPQEEADSALSLELKASVSDIAAIDGYALNPDYCETLRQTVRDAALVICAHPYLYRAVRSVWDGVIWLDAHNVEADMKAAILPPSKKRNAALELVRDVEQACVRDAGLVSCVSDADAKRFRQLYGELSETLIAPNGMDFKQVLFDCMLSGEALRECLGVNVPVAVFMGSNHGPNNEALKTLCDVAYQCDNIAFFVIGSVCDSLAGNGVPENIRLLGVLSESEKNVVFRAAQVALNPVTSGGGSNMKLSEYIAWRIPVLTTPFGARGFDLADGRHILVRELSDFPDAILHMTSVESRDEMAQMAAAAFDHAASIYDWSIVIAGLSEKFLSFCANRK